MTSTYPHTGIEIWRKPHKRTVPLSVAGAGTPSDTMSSGAEARLRTKWCPDPSSHLAIIYIGRKVGVVCPCHRDRSGSPSNTMWPGHSPTSLPSGILIHPTAWPQQTWAADYTDADKACVPKLRNWGLLCPFPWGTVSQSSTMWFGPRPTTTPSRILIHPTVWPQYSNVTDRQDRTGQTTVR